MNVTSHSYSSPSILGPQEHPRGCPVYWTVQVLLPPLVVAKKIWDSNFQAEDLEYDGGKQKDVSDRNWHSPHPGFHLIPSEEKGISQSGFFKMPSSKRYSKRKRLL